MCGLGARLRWVCGRDEGKAVEGREIWLNHLHRDHAAPVDIRNHVLQFEHSGRWGERPALKGRIGRKIRMPLDIFEGALLVAANNLARGDLKLPGPMDRSGRQG